MLKQPDNIEVKKDYEELRLELLQANYDLKDLVVAFGDVMTKEQYEKLLSFSNIYI